MATYTADVLRQFYDALYEQYGAQHWWPADTPLEVMVGAVLTQNTNWQNVERAIARLRAADLLDLAALRAVPTDRLAELIRPAGYFNVKARRLKSLIDMVWRQYDGDLTAMFAQPMAELREVLLSVRGVGPETADSILLYAGGHPTFVVDAYTYRVVVRHGLLDAQASYEDLKQLFEDAMEPDADLYNEYHALLVRVGKEHCRRRARCDGCPLDRFEHDPQTPV